MRGVRRCWICLALLDEAEVDALGTGTASDHWPCGLPLTTDDDLKLVPAPVGSRPAAGVRLQQTFDGAERCAGMGV